MNHQSYRMVDDSWFQWNHGAAGDGFSCLGLDFPYAIPVAAWG